MEKYLRMLPLINNLLVQGDHDGRHNDDDDDYFNSFAAHYRDEDTFVPIKWIDYLTIVIYFIIIIALGIWSARTNNQNTVDGYFLAGRKMHWILVGASIFSSNIGSEHFMGLAGSGASSGVGIAAFEYVAMYTILILGWYFMPVYLASNISTMPEYIQKRFGGQRIRVYLSILTLILYIFTKISASLFAGAVFIRLLLKIDNILICSIILIVISALFTIIGGLTAVIWTDSIQTLLMLLGAIFLSIKSIAAAGGYETLTANFRESGLPSKLESQSFENGCNASISNNTCVSCSQITEHYLHMFRPIGDPEIPWLGLLGIFVSCVWYWCTDQVIVQRALSAKNLTHAKAGCLLASMIKLLPMYLLVMPGMAARVLWPDQIGCSNPDYCEGVCQSRSGCTNLAYPYLILHLMPTGAIGLMFSVIIAALMSSLTSIFNSASTIFIIDIYLRFRKQAKEIEQIIAGRCFVVVLIIISIAWVPVIQTAQNSQLFPYIQSVTSYLSPPLCAVYVLAVFWSRITEPAAFWSLVIGLLIGLTQFILQFTITGPECGSLEQDTRPWILAKVHYLHFGLFLFCFSIILAMVISLMTAEVLPEYLYRLTFATRYSQRVRQEHEDVVDLRPSSQSNLKPMNADETNRIRKFLMIICCANNDGDQEADQQNNNSIYNNNDDQNLNRINIVFDQNDLAMMHAQAAKGDPKYSHLLNWLAIMVVAIATFFFGFYA